MRSAIRLSSSPLGSLCKRAAVANRPLSSPATPRKLLWTRGSATSRRTQAFHLKDPETRAAHETAYNNKRVLLRPASLPSMTFSPRSANGRAVVNLYPRRRALRNVSIPTANRPDQRPRPRNGEGPNGAFSAGCRFLLIIPWHMDGPCDPNCSVRAFDAIHKPLMFRMVSVDAG